MKASGPIPHPAAQTPQGSEAGPILTLSGQDQSNIPPMSSAAAAAQVVLQKQLEQHFRVQHMQQQKREEDASKVLEKKASLIKSILDGSKKTHKQTPVTLDAFPNSGSCTCSMPVLLTKPSNTHLFPLAALQGGQYQVELVCNNRCITLSDCEWEGTQSIKVLVPSYSAVGSLLPPHGLSSQGEGAVEPTFIKVTETRLQQDPPLLFEYEYKQSQVLDGIGIVGVLVDILQGSMSTSSGHDHQEGQKCVTQKTGLRLERPTKQLELLPLTEAKLLVSLERFVLALQAAATSPSTCMATMQMHLLAKLTVVGLIKEIMAPPMVNFKPKCMLALNLFLLTNPTADALDAMPQLAAPSQPLLQQAELSQLQEALAAQQQEMKIEGKYHPVS